jgi:lysophospholipase L1-like esterase
MHIVLLGDSIFDNGAYVPGGEPVITQVRSRLSPRSKATLLAKDGAISAEVIDQLRHLPAGATHLVISAGGNDALGSMSAMSVPVTNIGEALGSLAAIRRQFRHAYRGALDAVLKSQKAVAVCTIYEAIPDFPEAMQAGLAIFNDTIVREALAAGIGIIDLREICTDRDDFSEISPIEPSEQGGRKISDAVANWANGPGRVR